VRCVFKVLERKILRKIFGQTYENGSWRIQTNQELDKIIKHKNIINARNKNGQSNTLLEAHFKEANRKTKDTLGGC